MACNATCFQIQVQPTNITVLSATPVPNAAPCNTAANKTAAETAAKTQLADAEKRRNEDVNNCVQEQGCSCPPWPVWPVGGWAVTHKGLTSVQHVPIGTNCTWKVILKYDREERMRSAACKQG